MNLSPLHALNRLRAFFGKQSSDRELDTEMASHLEFAIEEYIRRGMCPDEARRQALVRFGGFEQAREQHRDSRGMPALDILMQDLRYAFRTLRRDRGFTVIAVVILALGIGANVTVFSVVDTILLRPLPFHDPGRLAWLTANEGKGGLSGTTYTVDAYQEFQRNNHSFEQVASFQPFYNPIQYKLTGRGEPQSVFGIQVSGNFFPTLGVTPLRGRLFSPEECEKGGRQTALLSYPFWQRQFNGDPTIIGQSITLNKEPVTVIGILPSSFDFGSVFSPGLKVDFYVPAVMDFGVPGEIRSRSSAGLNPASPSRRRRPNRTSSSRDSTPPTASGMKTTKPLFSTFKDYVSGKLRRSLIVLWSAVGLILLIVCVNLSNLLLARAAARGKEFAMRSALGAPRSRIVRQLLTESLLLSGAGALLGLSIAFALTFYLAHQGSIALPLLSSVRVDGPALAWTLLIAVTAAVFFGLVPAFKVSSGNLQDSLKDIGPGMSQGAKHEGLRAALVISEVALACVLLIGAGLLLRSFLRVIDVDLGFEPARAAAIDIDYDDGGNPDRRGAIFQNLLSRVNAIPGIESAGIADMLPLDRNRSWGFQAKGRTYRPGELQGILVYVVTPGYLPTMGIHFRGGRDFTWRDGAKTEPVVIINEAAARFHYPGQDPVGRIGQVNDHDARIVGVIANLRESSLEDVSSPQMYLPATQAGPEGATLVIRTRLDPASLHAGVMQTLRSINPGQPASEFRPIQQVVDHAVSPRRFFVLLVTIFAALALLLASLGIYGVISYSVTRQTQEIGIRMALGATERRVQIGVISKTLRLALIGIAVGALGSLGVAHLIASLLFGTAPTDPATFVGMALLLGLVAVLAGYIPARRASRINPIQALRSN